MCKRKIVLLERNSSAVTEEFGTLADGSKEGGGRGGGTRLPGNHQRKPILISKLPHKGDPEEVSIYRPVLRSLRMQWHLYANDTDECNGSRIIPKGGSKS